MRICALLFLLACAILFMLWGPQDAYAACGRHCNEKTEDDTYVDCGWLGAPPIKSLDYHVTYKCEDPPGVQGGCTGVHSTSIPFVSLVGTLAYSSKDTYSAEAAGQVPWTVQVPTGTDPPEQDGVTFKFLFTGQAQCENKVISPAIDSNYKTEDCNY